MKKRYWILLILTLLIAVFYLIPNPTKSFEELYTGEESIKKSLLEFRKLPLKTTTIDGVDWEYLSTGQGEETIVFLHGMGGAYDIWWQQIEALKDEYNVISVTYPAVEQINGLADAVIQIMDLEDVEKANIVGSSLGGYLTQNIVARYPERVEKAVFGNTFPPNDTIKAKNAGLAKVIPKLPEWFIMKFFRGNLEKTVVPTSENSPLVKAYLFEQDYGIMSKAQFIARFKCVIDKFEPADLSQSNIPVLIIDADNDPLIYPNLKEEMKTTYPQAEHFRFEGTGHFTYLNRPVEYTNIIEDFLKKGKKETSVRSTIERLYFNGRKEGDVDKLKQIFLVNAQLTTVEDGISKVADLDGYLSHVAQQGAVKCETSIVSVNITETIASVKTHFDYGAVKYTDYLNLIETNEGWKIANKTYMKN